MSEEVNNDITEYDFDRLSEQEQCEIIKNYLLTKKEGEKLIPQVFITFFQQIAYETLTARGDEQKLTYDDHKINITPTNTQKIKDLDNKLKELSNKDKMEIITDANIEADDNFQNYQNAKAATQAQQLAQEHEKQQRDIETYNIITRNNENELELFLNTIDEKEQNKILRGLDTEKKATSFIKSFPLTVVDTEILDRKDLDRSRYIDVFNAKNDDWLMRKTHKMIFKALQNPEIVTNIIAHFPTEEAKEDTKRIRKFILARFFTNEKEFLNKQNFKKIDIDTNIISPSAEQTEDNKKAKDPPNTKNKTLEILQKKQEIIKKSKFLGDDEKECLSHAINEVQEQLEQDEKNEITTKEHRKALEAIDNQITKFKKEFLERNQKEKQDKYIAERKEKYDDEKQRVDTIEKNNEETKRCANKNIATTLLKPIPSAKKPIPFFFDGGQVTLFTGSIASLAIAIALAILTNPLFATIAVASLVFTATGKVRQTKEQQKVDIENATNYVKANMAQYQGLQHQGPTPAPIPAPLPTPYSEKMVKYVKTKTPWKSLNNKICTNLENMNKSQSTSVGKQ